MTLTDTGPLVALLDPRDVHHAACVEVARRERLLTTIWPVVTEATHLLSRVPGGADAVLSMIHLGGLTIAALGEGDVPRIRQLLAKYADTPMDLADAALVRIAEREGIRRIFTTDRRHFGAYRAHGRERFTLVP